MTYTEARKTRALSKAQSAAQQQAKQWPACCGGAACFIMPAGIGEIQKECPELEGAILNHIIYNMRISGNAATRLLESLQRDKGPTLYVFRCPKCGQHHFTIENIPTMVIAGKLNSNG